jgi:hypothetical protein
MPTKIWKMKTRGEHLWLTRPSDVDGEPGKMTLTIRQIPTLRAMGNLQEKVLV